MDNDVSIGSLCEHVQTGESMRKCLFPAWGTGESAALELYQLYHLLVIAWTEQHESHMSLKGKYTYNYKKK